MRAKTASLALPGKACGLLQGTLILLDWARSPDTCEVQVDWGPYEIFMLIGQRDPFALCKL